MDHYHFTTSLLPLAAVPLPSTQSHRRTFSTRHIFDRVTLLFRTASKNASVQRMRKEIIIPTTYCAPHFVLSIGKRARNGTETQMQGDVDKKGTIKRHRLVSDSSKN